MHARAYASAGLLALALAAPDLRAAAPPPAPRWLVNDLAAARAAARKAGKPVLIVFRCER